MLIKQCLCSSILEAILQKLLIFNVFIFSTFFLYCINANAMNEIKTYHCIKPLTSEEKFKIQIYKTALKKAPFEQKNDIKTIIWKHFCEANIILAKKIRIIQSLKKSNDLLGNIDNGNEVNLEQFNLDAESLIREFITTTSLTAEQFSNVLIVTEELIEFMLNKSNQSKMHAEEKADLFVTKTINTYGDAVARGLIYFALRYIKI